LSCFRNAAGQTQHSPHLAGDDALDAEHVELAPRAPRPGVDRGAPSAAPGAEHPAVSSTGDLDLDDLLTTPVDHLNPLTAPRPTTRLNSDVTRILVLLADPSDKK
jgi:hypothetical protein